MEATLTPGRGKSIRGSGSVWRGEAADEPVVKSGFANRGSRVHLFMRNGLAPAHLLRGNKNGRKPAWGGG